MTAWLLAVSLLAGPTLAERTKTARPALATPPVLEGCEEAEAQISLGRVPDDPLKARVLAASGASTLRVFAKGQPITQDRRSDRLNLETDAAGRVLSARCF